MGTRSSLVKREWRRKCRQEEIQSAADGGEGEPCVAAVEKKKQRVKDVAREGKSMQGEKESGKAENG